MIEEAESTSLARRDTLDTLPRPFVWPNVRGWSAARGSSVVVGDAYIVGAIMLLALIFGAAGLGSHHLWYDEGYSLMFATASWADFVTALHHLDGPVALYYLLLRGWLTVMPVSISSLRVPSLLFSVGTIPVVYALGRTLHSRSAGLFAAAFLACNASWWLRVEDARVYALAVFVSSVGLLLFSRVLYATPSSRTTVLAGAFSGLTILLQAVIGWTTLFAEGVSALCSSRRFSRGVIGSIGIGVLLGGVSIYVIVHLGTTDAAWLRTHKTIVNGVGDLVQALGIRFSFAPAAIAVVAALWVNRADPKIRTIALWVIVPIVTIYASQYVRPLLVDRYMLAALPPVIVLLGVGTASLRNRTAMFVIALLVIVGESCETIRATTRDHESWERVITVLQTQTQPGDVVNIIPRGRASGNRALARGHHAPERHHHLSAGSRAPMDAESLHKSRAAGKLALRNDLGRFLGISRSLRAGSGL
jgi:mannosyltransferase